MIVNRAFVKVASKKDLTPGKMIGTKAAGKAILVVNLEGKYYAIGDACTHKGCMLSKGVLKGTSVECPCHGSVFDVKTGGVVKGPAMKPEPVFQVKVEGEQILVNV